MQIEIVEIKRAKEVLGLPGAGPAFQETDRVLQCPQCGTQGSIYVRILCSVAFDAEFYNKGNDIGIGFSMSTANDIETKGEAQPICGNCGQYLELPAGMRAIQDV